jgi:trimeric autotransporter adhesin
MPSARIRTAAILAVGLLFVSMAFAQMRSATITGSVRDSTGAIVPSAVVVVTNQETNVRTETKTTDAGQFTIPYLQAGVYMVLVEVQGFVPYKETGIALATAQTVRVDVTLQVGAVNSVIEVSASVGQIQTDSGTVQAATTANVIAAIPNITQNPFYYATLQAGVVPRAKMADTMGANSFGIGYEGRNAFSAFSVNGGNAFMNDMQLDGLSIQGGAKNDAMIVPNTEGLQEVRVTSNDFSAEYGRGHGIISLSTKSGTNQYHGQATYRLRNEALNANSNSNNANRISRGPFKVHEFGGAVGGPIRKDRLFFFTSYHRLMHNRGVDWLLTVPTNLARVGNYSQTYIRNTDGTALPAQLFDPFNVTNISTNKYQRAAYPGAIIPNPDKYGLKILSYYPQPNRTPDDLFETNNYGVRTVKEFRRHSENSRLDYAKGKHSIYGSGGISYGTITTGRPYPDSPFMPSGSDLDSDKNLYGQIGDTIILSPTLVVDIRYGMTRLHMKNFGGDKQGYTEYDAIGVPKAVQGVMPIPGAAPALVPSTGGGAGGSFSSLGSVFVGKHERQLVHDFVGSVMKLHGRWTHKVGAEFRDLLSNYSDPREDSVGNGIEIGGNYNFQWLDASGNSLADNTSPLQKGLNGALLLTGAGYWNIRVRQSVLPAFGQRYYSLYSQNDWRPYSKLTINLGLRWDVQPGPTERFNRLASLDLSANNAWGGKGVMAFAGTGGNSRNLWDARWKDFGPRLGFAYQLTPDTVIRGGFGISYLPSNTGYFDGPTLYGAAPFGFGTDGQPYGLNPNGVPVGRFSDLAPTRVIKPIGPLPADPRVYGATDVMFERKTHQDGRVAQWNLFLQKRIGRAWLASAGYSASRSVNLEYYQFPFQGIQNIAPSTLAAWKSQYIANNGTDPSTLLVANPYQPTSGALLPFMGELAKSTVRAFVPMLPNPLLIAYTTDPSIGFGNYQSMQLRMSRMLANGFQLDANYTWSKSLDFVNGAASDAQGINTGGGGTSADILNYQNNRKYSFNDIPHRFVATAVYELPLGSGKALALSNKTLRSIVGQWQVSGVLISQSGTPLGASGASDGAALARPNRIPGVAIEVPKELQHWYDGVTTVTLPSGRRITPAKNTFLKYSSDAFRGQTVTVANGASKPDLYWWGTSAPTFGDIRTPGRVNLDLTVRRTFKIRERMNLEFAADATNILNHTQYSGSYSTGLGSTNLTTNTAKGLVPGMGTSDTFGTLGVATFDPRQVQLNLRLTF